MGSSAALEDLVELGDLAADAAAHLVAELEHARVADRVAHVVAVLGAGDHAGGMQDAEVLGDVLLGGAERLLELSDRRLTLPQAVQELDPHRLAEHPEALGDELDQRLGKRMGHGLEYCHERQDSTSARLWS